VTSFSIIWGALRRRPLAVAATVLSLTLLLHFPGRAAGEAASVWFSGQSPSVSSPLFEILMNWIVPFVAASAVMLTYHATRLTPRQNDRADIVPDASRSSQDNLQIWFLFAYALAIFSIGEMLLAKPVAPSNVPPAPAGPDARVDAFIQALETRLVAPPPAQPDRGNADVVKAIARLLWLESEYAKFERAAAQYDSVFERIFSDLKQNNPVKDKELKLYQNTITNMAKTDLDQSIDLSRHPVYDQHPQLPVPGEDTLANESDKANYRRYQSQYASAKSTIDGIKEQYENEMRQARWVVFGFASGPSRQSGQGDEPNRAAPASGDGRGQQK
jgi:hypothetical protein